MLGKELQDVVWEKTPFGECASYSECKDFVMTLAKNRLSRGGKDSDAMDIGQAEKGDEEGWDQSQDWGAWDPTYDMNAVGKGKGKGKCWNCGEAGHMKKDCPKPKGYGKGGNAGKGSQPQKGSGKGYGNTGTKG